MYRYWMLGQAFLLIFGLWWCRDVFRRFPRDLDAVRTSKDRAEKVAIIFWWGVTGIVLCLMVLVSVHVVRKALPVFSGW